MENEVNNYELYINFSELCKKMKLKNSSARLIQNGIKPKKIKVKTNSGIQEMNFIKKEDACFFVATTRKPIAEKKGIIKMINFERFNKKNLLKKNLENEFFDKLKTILFVLDENISFLREFKIKNYRVDLFIPDYGLIIEYDEYHHKAKIESDKKRESEIKKIIMEDYEIEPNSDLCIEDNRLLGVNFIRVKQGKEFEGIGEVIKQCVLEGMLS